MSLRSVQYSGLRRSRLDGLNGGGGGGGGGATVSIELAEELDAPSTHSGSNAPPSAKKARTAVTTKAIKTNDETSDEALARLLHTETLVDMERRRVQEQRDRDLAVEITQREETRRRELLAREAEALARRNSGRGASLMGWRDADGPPRSSYFFGIYGGNRPSSALVRESLGATAAHASPTTDEIQDGRTIEKKKCTVCYEHGVNVVLGCGHMFCGGCIRRLSASKSLCSSAQKAECVRKLKCARCLKELACPKCRADIEVSIPIFPDDDDDDESSDEAGDKTAETAEKAETNETAAAAAAATTTTSSASETKVSA